MKPAALATAALAAALAAAGCAAHTPAPRHAATPAASYDLAGFKRVAGGPPMHAVQADLAHLYRDEATGNPVTALIDARALRGDTTALLAALETTSPPPDVRAPKAHLTAGVRLMHQAAVVLTAGLQTEDGSKVQTAAGLIGAAGYQIKQATAALP